MVWLLLFVTIALAALAAWLWQQMARLRIDNVALAAAQSHAQADVDVLRSTQNQVMHSSKLASLGQMVTGIAHEISLPLGFVQGNVDTIADLLDDYRKLVKQYDAAVQYCQQPVDLMFGADKESLDKLVKHVEDARRKLFEARANVEKTPLLKDAKQLLADCRDGVGQLASLVNNLKGLGRDDDGGASAVDLNECLGSALAIAQHRIGDNIEVVRQLGTLPKVRCMPAQMNQVFLNLITNAAQAMDGDGKLTIDSRAAGDHVEVSFADTGVGIPDDVLPKIFDPFFTTRPVGEGNGLGLSIVHKILKNHGGSIKVRTTPKKGSVFTLSLPLNTGALGAGAVHAAGV